MLKTVILQIIMKETCCRKTYRCLDLSPQYAENQFYRFAHINTYSETTEDVVTCCGSPISSTECGQHFALCVSENLATGYWAAERELL